MKNLLAFSILLMAFGSTGLRAQSGDELRFCLRSEPKTLNPLLAADDASETIRYLTGGVLMRVNRLTQDLEPELATSWKITNGGKTITFQLRDGLRFSDGTPFSADDVAYTMQQLMDPALHSPTGDAFRSSEGKVETQILPKNRVRITFPAPIAGLDRLFDQVAIMSAKSPQKEMAVLGPYFVGENKAGSYLILKRNPNYWEKDPTGRPLPYIESVRLDIQQNRDIEMLRLTRGEIHFINSLDAEYFDKVVAQDPSMAHDAGASLDSEEMWFNQVANSPLPSYKKAWFTSTNFPAGNFGSHQSRRSGPDRFPRTCASSGRAGFSGQQVLVQCQAASRIPSIRNLRYSVWLRMGSICRTTFCTITTDTLSSSP